MMDHTGHVYEEYIGLGFGLTLSAPPAAFPAPPATLAQLQQRLLDDPSAVSNLRWAVRAALVAAPESAHAPLSLDLIADIVRSLRKMPQGRSANTCTNIGNRLRAALRGHRPDLFPTAGGGGSAAELLSPWVPLASAIPEHHTHSPLSRFVRWCSDRGHPPEEIGDGHVLRYLASCQHRLKHPRIHVRKVIALWNAAMTSAAGWPTTRLLPLPAVKETYAAEPAELAPELWSALEAYFRERLAAASSPLRRRSSGFQPLRQQSADKGIGNLRQLLGMMRNQGKDIGTIRTIEDLLGDETLEAALIAIHERRRQESSTQAANIAATVVALARDLCPERYEAVREMFEALKPVYRGMTDQNIQRLTPFRDPANRRKLACLPFAWAEKAHRQGGKQGARLMRDAVAFMLLMAGALRRGELFALRLSDLTFDREGQPKILTVLMVVTTRGAMTTPSAASFI